MTDHKLISESDDHAVMSETATKSGYVGSLPTPHYTDELVTLHNGDACQVIAAMPDESVDCIVTSPPYFGLRDYGVEGQYGLEDSPSAYVETMRSLFAECRRVLAKDGTLWLNIGDSYYSGRGNPGPNSDDHKQVARRGWTRPLDQCGADWAKPKDLLGIPWRVAFALQDDGWTLRNAVVWHKPNAMPESVTDRLSCDYEHVFLFSRSRTYWFDLDPIREPLAYPAAADGTRVIGGVNKGVHGGVGATARRRGHSRYGEKVTAADSATAHRFGPNDASTLGSGHESGRNPGSVWDIPTQPFPSAHFAVMPVALAQRCIAAGCKPGGTVLDPFSGSGTTGLAATKLGRRYVGIDLNSEYLDLSLRTRLAQGSLDFGAVS